MGTREGTWTSGFGGGRILRGLGVRVKAMAWLLLLGFLGLGPFS